MTTPPLTAPQGDDAVAAARDRFRRADADLQRRRHQRKAASRNDIAVVRLVYAAADTGTVCTPRTLREALNVSSASVSVLLDRMQGAGLVERRPHPSDRRSVLIVPVEPRRSIGDTVALTDQIAALDRALPPESAAVLVRYFTHLADLLDAEHLPEVDGTAR